MRTKPSELLDLRTVPPADLQKLIDICASHNVNRFFQDNFVILSRILFAQHQCSGMSEYTDQELEHAESVFLDLLERNQQLPNEHPTHKFLSFNFGAAYDERERRKKQTTIRRVK